MPGSVGGAGFHGGEDVDQPGMIAPLCDDALDPVFLTKGLVAANELDLNAGIRSELFGVVAQRVPQGFCPAGVVG